MINYSASYTDLYELTMAQVYFETGRENDCAVFDYFFRGLPFGGGYVVFAGLEDLIAVIKDLRFSDRDLSFLKSIGFTDQFVQYLQGFRFRGNIYACSEGEIVFGTEPLIQVPKMKSN